jgi:hypothetical protein
LLKTDAGFLPVQEITGHTAQGGGIITDDGVKAIAESDIVWSTEGDLTVIMQGQQLIVRGYWSITSILKGLAPEFKAVINWTFMPHCPDICSYHSGYPKSTSA